MRLDLPQQLFPNPFPVARGDKAALTRHRAHQPFAFQLVIRPLGRDNADPQVLRQRADGGQRLARRQFAGEDLLFNLRRNLLVNRQAGRIADEYLQSVHLRFNCL